MVFGLQTPKLLYHNLLISKGQSVRVVQFVAKGLESAAGQAVPGDAMEVDEGDSEMMPPERGPGRPGDPQGWWWEREEGLFAPQSLDEESGLAAAICASNILRNLGLSSGTLLAGWQN